MRKIGLGLDFQHRASYGKPMDELLNYFSDRLSHISIVGLIEDRDVTEFKSLTKLPILHHFTGVEPAGVDGVQLAAVRRQCEIAQQLQALWCLEDIGIWSIGPYNIPYFAPPVLCNAVLEATIDGVHALQKEVSIPFLAELPSCSFIAGDMSLPEFFTRLVGATGCGIVLDVSHVFSYAIYSDQSPLAVLAALPLASVVEIHVAGGSVHPSHSWRYRDTHTEPVLDGVIAILTQALKACSNLRAVTYEIGLGIGLDLVEEELARLQQMADTANFQPRLYDVQ